MRKTTIKAFSLLLTFVMILGLLPTAALAANGTLTGEGTAQAPYLIDDAADLKAFRDLVNSSADNKTLCAKLTADIDLNNEPWTPFHPSSGYITEAYAGTFDGDGHTIKGLFINADSAYQGLFGTINGATIKNLVVQGSITSSKSYVGGIVGKVQQGSLVNCSFSGSVTTTTGYVGGIAGYTGNSQSQTAQINGCSNNGTISGVTAGGIVGYAKYTTITNCYNTKSISGTTRAGGIAGQLQNNCTVSNCYNIGAFNGSATASGICDFLYSTSKLENCYSITSLFGSGTGSTSNCEIFTSSEGLAEKLGSAFTTDTQGNIILAWQTSGGSVVTKPEISIAAANGTTLHVQTGGSNVNSTTLTASCANMGDEAPQVSWIWDKNSKAASCQISQNDPNALIVTADDGGVLEITASAVYQDESISKTIKITVIPHFTAVTIRNVTQPGAVAIGQTVEAVLHIQGGDAFVPEEFPELALTYQWYCSGAPIDGATASTYKISADCSEWSQLGVAIKCNGTLVHSYEDHYESIRSEAYGKLYSTAYDEGFTLPEKIKEERSLALPASWQKDVLASIQWSSTNPAVIAEDGTVHLPESGTASVTLTAKFTYEDAFANRSFTITVYSPEAAREEENNTLAQLESDLGKLYTMHPVYGQDSNVLDMLNAKLAGKNITTAIKNIEEVYGGAEIAADGSITYFYADPNAAPATRFGSYRVTFSFSRDGVSTERTIPIVIYWDADRVKAAMQEEILAFVTDASISDGDSGAVTENLTLPKVIDNKQWTQISWSSSNENVIAISSENQTTADTLFAPYIGIVKPGEQPQQVTLTATFTFQLTNDITGSEEPIVLYKTFSLTVAPMNDEQASAIRRALMEKLDAGFLAKGLTDAVTNTPLAYDELTGQYIAKNDIQLPTTHDFGVDGKYYPITITSSNPDVIVAPDVRNAARVTVLRPAVGQDDAFATITVTLTDKDTSVTASKTFTIHVSALTSEEVAAEKALMEQVKANFFEGIKGRNSDPNEILTDLSPFQEVYADDEGNLVWIRDISEMKGSGIVPTPIKGWEEEEAYRLFRSSNPAVVAHETLTVTRQANPKEVTITSYLSSETLGRYGELYARDPVTYAQYEDLADLYYQPVTAQTISAFSLRTARTAAQGAKLTVRGTSNPDDSVAIVEPLNNISFTLYGVTNEVWIETVTLDNLDETSSAYDVLRSVLSSNDYTFTRERGSYISSITKPDGTKLTEKSMGDKSGWLYQVNGKHPEVYMGACGLHSGDSIVVYFTEDASKDDPNWGNWPSSGSTVQKPQETATVTKNESDGTYTITLPADAEGPQIVTIPDVQDGQLAVILRADGSEEVIKKAIVDAGRMKLMIGENVTIKIVDYHNSFRDVADSAWYASAVDFVAGHELFHGVDGNRFAPHDSLTRGMLVKVLYQLESPLTTPDSIAFPDVPSNAWYAPGAAWAAQSGIVKGYDNGNFGPNDPATREQLAVMLFGYAKYLGLSTGGRDSLNSFQDSSEVSSWARDAVAWAVDSGIISGKDNNRLDPSGIASRAEAAEMFRQFVSLIVK